jgi:hypothetical protein
MIKIWCLNQAHLAKTRTLSSYTGLRLVLFTFYDSKRATYAAVLTSVTQSNFCLLSRRNQMTFLLWPGDFWFHFPIIVPDIVVNSVSLKDRSYQFERLQMLIL